MKFLKQARNFQKTLLKQSRFFTSIMLVSGMGLVVAAPFLSYEASSIQCYEKTENVIIINEGETVIMKGELERKDKEIERFKKRLNALDRRMDCKDVIDDLESDREELIEQLNECEKSLNDCISNDSDLQGLQDRIDELLEENEKLKKAIEACGTDYSEVDELKAEISKLNTEIAVLERKLKACLENGAGNDELKKTIEGLNGKIKRLESLIENYKNKLRACEAEKGNSSDKLYFAFRLEDRESFRFNKSTFSRKELRDAAGGIKYELHLNNKSIARNLSKNGATYKFKDSGKSYRIKLIRQSKVSSYLEIERV